MDFTEAFDVARHASTTTDEEPSVVERARAVLKKYYDDGHGDLRILTALPDDGPLYQSTLVDDPDVDLGKAGSAARSAVSPTVASSVGIATGIERPPA